MIAQRTESIPLHFKSASRFDGATAVLRVTDDSSVDDRQRHASLLADQDEMMPGFAAYLCIGNEPIREAATRCLTLPDSASHLTTGDIVRINPERGELWVMYRVNSQHNSMLVTERCNSFCVMCSQPPKKLDDSYLLNDWLEAVPLMSPSTRELGITGGEPTLLNEGLLKLLQKCKEHLPDTAIHILSNGRKFSDIEFAKSVADVGCADLMIGVPLYSDIAWRHEMVVQAPGSFDETVFGLLNLARCHVPVEIRVVIHQQTYERLPQLARYITRNLPFASHVALMGFEPIGFGKSNFNALWIDPADYVPQMERAVSILDGAGLTVSIYNHQLCTLPEGLWPFARQSISDWKNIYLLQCRQCSVAGKCAGFFHSAVDRYSRLISPISFSNNMKV